MQIGVAEPGRGHPQQDLARPRNGHRNLAYLGGAFPRDELHGLHPDASRTASASDFMPPCAACPPSTAISAPLIQLDSSEIRKTTSGATSSAVPRRPSGISPTTMRVHASGASSAIGVAITPGKIVLTRTPKRPSSMLATRETPRSPHLLAV